MGEIQGGIYLSHLKYEVIKPALEYLKLGEENAINQVMGTFLAEGYASGCTYLKQLKKGPAVGILQMEPVTYQDIWNNYLTNPRHSAHAQALRKIAGSFNVDNKNIPKVETLTGNIFFAAAMCRIFYLRITAPLPQANDATAMAQYHKKYYNTALGKANWQINISRFQQAINC